MVGIKTSGFVLLCFVLVVGVFVFIASADSDIMTVEANIFAQGGDDNNNSIIQVEVPDYLFFGNVSLGDISDEMKIYVNNTGNVDIRVTPRLTNHSEEIFSYLSFRKFKTSNGSAVPFRRIGDFDFDIDKPSGNDEYKSMYIYMALDLRNYTGNLNQNLMRHRADVRFFAAEI